MGWKYKKIASVDELKECIDNGMHNYFLCCGTGFRSSKFITPSGEEGKTFCIYNEIDDSEIDLTEEEIMDTDYTNIGLAITRGAFFGEYYEKEAE